MNEAYEQAGSAAERIRAALETRIISGQIAPGDRLNELLLTEQFGVSRGPVREALRALEQARLIDLVPNKGARVRVLTLSDALELFDIRAGLAATAGRSCAARATKTEIAMLRQLHRDMEAAASAGATDRFHALNLSFHDAIMDCAGNKRLREMEALIRNELQLYLRQGILGDAQLRSSNAEHRAFLAAIAAGDVAKAGDRLEQHVLNGKQRIMAMNRVAARAPG